MTRLGTIGLLTLGLLLGAPAAAFADTVGSSRDGTTDPKMLIFMVLGVLALIAVSSLGPLARMSERRAELKGEHGAAQKVDALKVDPQG